MRVGRSQVSERAEFIRYDPFHSSLRNRPYKLWKPPYFCWSDSVINGIDRLSKLLYAHRVDQWYNEYIIIIWFKVSFLNYTYLSLSLWLRWLTDTVLR